MLALSLVSVLRILLSHRNTRTRALIENRLDARISKTKSLILDFTELAMLKMNQGLMSVINTTDSRLDNAKDHTHFVFHYQ